MAFNYWQQFEEGNIYHIYNHAVGDEDLFRSDFDYENFLFKYNYYFKNYFSTYAYCLMPNHFHFLCKVKPFEEVKIYLQNEKTKVAKKVIDQELLFDDFIIDQMRRFFSSITLKYNRRYDRKGSLFYKRFKRVIVKNETKLLYYLCYIHHNPIHHNFASDYSQWKYSSFSSYTKNLNSIIEKKEILDWIGGLNIFIENHDNFKIIPGNQSNLD